MNRSAAIAQLIEALSELPTSDGLMNPYNSAKGPCAADSQDEIGPGADAIRKANLASYLERQIAAGADAILCGEAPSYQGCRFTGIAFCSEREVVSRTLDCLADCKLLPGAANGTRRIMKELSAKSLWEAHGRAVRPFIHWNAVQLHPHEPGKALTNRTPKPAEWALGAETLSLLIEIVRPRVIVAVGKTAEKALGALGHEAPYVRHPSYGGKAEFMKGLENLGIIRP